MRTFQFSDAKSHKFWNIEVKDTYYEVTFGKVGSAGQRQRKTFATNAEAQADADRLIEEKLKKGYVETTPKAVTEAEAFEAALRANPDDLAGWCAYADYLVEHGDPRGEFMQTQIALEDEKRPKSERAALEKKEAALLKEHEKEWVGDWPDLFPAPTETEGRGQINHTGERKYEFKRGVLATANFGVLTVAAARAFVKAPQTRFVRELFVGYYAWEEEFEPGPDVPGMTGDDDPAGHILLRWPYMRHVRRFQYGWIADEVYGNFCNFQCHLSGDLAYDFVKQMPDVEEVLIFAHVQDATKLAALPMPNLRVLQLYHGWSVPLDKIAKNASLTKLTHLLCHPHALDDEEAYIRLPGLRAVCRSPHLSSLTHLRLRLADFGDAGIREIVSSGILMRLKELDLRHGCITDEGAKLLAACPDVKNLERLDLSRNRLTDEGVKAIQATKVPVELDHQRALKGTEDEYEQRQYLYEADYE
ncbi:MAG: WGR domain-containing protein [Planctomycetes bacterium]|nr:WGR domain-containing protein [Planctomycetota bacterium]